jgi:hypothetical protein
MPPCWRSCAVDMRSAYCATTAAPYRSVNLAASHLPRKSECVPPTRQGEGEGDGGGSVTAAKVLGTARVTARSGGG